jgi:DNA repair photolyase
MLKSLRLRLERLEAARGKGARNYIIIRPLVPGEGEAFVTEIKDGRVLRHGLVGPEEVARLREGAITIERSYAAAERSAV